MIKDFKKTNKQTSRTKGVKRQKREWRPEEEGERRLREREGQH